METMVKAIILKLRATKTMSELDSLRQETFEAMNSGGREAFESVQNEFIKAKNRVRH